MTYGGFQRLSEASAYSKRKREQLEQEKFEAQERKDTLEKCEEASQKINNGDEKGVEELSTAFQELLHLIDSQDRDNY